jgi:hypothetical protein
LPIASLYLDPDAEASGRTRIMEQSKQLDVDKLKDYSKRVFGALGGAMTSSMIYLGDRLGLYAALAAGGAATSEELAARTQLDERWLREWLYQQGAAGVLEHRGAGRFELTPEGCAVLADESHPAFGAGFFSHFPETIATAERLPESFRTGLGLPYDALGPGGARGVERGVAAWFRAWPRPFRSQNSTATRSPCTRSSAPKRIGARRACRTSASTAPTWIRFPTTRASPSSRPSTVCTTWRTPGR